MRRIGGILGRKPFGPIYEHTAKVMDCLGQVLPLVKAFTAGKDEEVSSHVRLIVQLEGEADWIKNEIRRNLSSSLFRAAERSEILNILQRQDRISDSCEKLAKLLDVRRTAFPEALAQEFLNHAHQAAETARSLADLMQSLQESSSVAFSRKEIPAIEAKVIQVHRGEHEADILHSKFLQKLFSIEKELDPVTVILLMDMAQGLDEIANEAENTADCVIRIVLL